MKRLLFISIVVLTINLVYGQHEIKTKEIPVLEGEKWWGGMTALGSQAPFGSNLGLVDMSKNGRNNQVTGFLVSNLGRYIYSENAFDMDFNGSRFLLKGIGADTLEVRRVGKTLRQAYMAAAQRHFATDVTVVPKEFITHPQYNTWIELNYNQNQADVEVYAQGILDSGLPAGIIMIDDSWQQAHGIWDFRRDRFEDPKGLIKRLHAKGFKVMVWVAPFVSADSREAMLLDRKGYLIRNKDNQVDLIRWWNGASACYDFTNPQAREYFVNYLKEKQKEYGIDGFKFDAGDFNFYNSQTQISHKKDALPTDHLLGWTMVGKQFPYNEFRATWNMQGQPLVQRLGDKDYSWDAMRLLMPEMINAGLCGYAFTCPDMIGGGQFGNFENLDQNKIDQDLIVRSAQVHALMPMMQFSVAPWRVLDATHMAAVKKAVDTRQKFVDYIYSEAQKSAKTGEPIIRNMEYNYAHKGFSDCKDQFAIGEELIVAPIVTKDGQRTVRLPRGRWMDDLGMVHKGPRVLEISAPIDRLPHYKLIKK